jgi:hypothetical protein
MPEETINNSADKLQREEAVSRRGLFHVLGSLPVAAIAARPAVAEVNPHHVHLPAPATRAVTPPGPYKFRIFNDHQLKTVNVLCDLIIPADERSGSATQAGVPEFIDDWIAFRNEQNGSRDFEAQILGGLSWLDRESNRAFEKNFVDASTDQQKKLLDRIAFPDRAAKEDATGVSFFSKIRDLTVSGFFSSKVGVQDLPYLGNTAVAEWKGCDPKVWSIIEDRMKNGYKGVAGPEVKPWKS